jgi:zinc/manganese transport system substrate-binding protein
MKINTKTVVLSLSVLLTIFLVFIIGNNLKTSNNSNSEVIQVVAAENFWGSLVSQIGGNKINTTSIVSDPNADPHEYETSNVNAREFAQASYVILNGAGYDSWGNKLVSASPKVNQVVLNVADFLDKKNGDNPHFWYGPSYVNKTIVQMEKDLAKIDPSDSNYFQNNLVNLQSSLLTYQGRINDIKQSYSGTKVSATEDIFQYLADAAGLNLISPSAFTQAVAEGNDPPTNSVVVFQNQLQNGQSKLLVYNNQTVTPLTNNMKNLAIKQSIPILGISETIQPASLTFQDWMNNQVIQLQKVLGSNR